MSEVKSEIRTTGPMMPKPDLESKKGLFSRLFRLGGASQKAAEPINNPIQPKPEEPTALVSEPAVKIIAPVVRKEEPKEPDFKEISSLPNSELMPTLLTSLDTLTVDEKHQKELEIIKKSLRADLPPSDLEFAVEYLETLPIDDKTRFIVNTILARPGIFKESKIQEEGEIPQVESTPNREEVNPQTFEYDLKQKAWVPSKEGSSGKETPRPFGFLEYRGVKPRNVTSWENSPYSIIVNNESLFFLPGGDFQIKLDKLTIPAARGSRIDEILLGVIMPDSDLQGYLQKELGLSKQQRLPEGQLTSEERLFFIRLQNHLSGLDQTVLRTARSIWHVPYSSNKGGGDRVYYADAGRIDGKRVILTVAACDKADQSSLLRKIASNSITGTK